MQLIVRLIYPISDEEKSRIEGMRFYYLTLDTYLALVMKLDVNFLYLDFEKQSSTYIASKPFESNPLKPNLLVYHRLLHPSTKLRDGPIHSQSKLGRNGRLERPFRGCEGVCPGDKMVARYVFKIHVDLPSHIFSVDV